MFSSHYISSTILQVSGWYIRLSWYSVIFQLACVVSLNELRPSEQTQWAAEAVSEQTISVAANQENTRPARRTSAECDMYL